MTTRIKKKRSIEECSLMMLLFVEFDSSFYLREISVGIVATYKILLMPLIVYF